MSKYTYYVFLASNGFVAEPVYTDTREAMDRSAEEHGKINGYNAAIGPFRTKRAALFMEAHGQGNPHLRTVADAERIAKQEQRA